MRKFSQSKCAIARGREYAIVREGGCASDRYAHRIWACDEKDLTEQGAPSHVVEGIQLVVRAGARTIDTGVGNAVCNQNVSRGERAYRDGGRANQSVPMKKFGPGVEKFFTEQGRYRMW